MWALGRPGEEIHRSDYLSPANDAMTQAVHAFVHFAWTYSHEQLFCDMQGM